MKPSVSHVVPGKPDIFLSYAWADNEELPDGSPGWVSEFAKWLRIGLGRALGRRDACELWMDLQLPSNARLTPEIEAKVRDCAVMIIVLSKAYLQSDWCTKELSQFLQEEVRRRYGSGSRIFVVEMSNLPRPAALQKEEVVGKRFWMMDPLSQRVHPMGFSRAERGDPHYINQIMELSEEIAAELERQRKALGDVQPEPVPIPTSRAVVYLAEVSDDLEDLRDEVKRYLSQAQYQVLPERRYPDDIAGFEEAVRANLDRCVVYVQLLSEVAGLKFEGSDRRRVAAQYELVTGRSMPVLLWCSRSLELAKVKDTAHRKRIENPEIMAVDIEEFKATIVDRVRKTLTPPPPSKKQQFGRDYLVFVNAAEDDFPLANSVSRELDRRSIGYVLPLRQGQPSAIRQDLEQNLRECDGVILIFGQTDALWVKTQLLQARKIITQREPPPPIVAVYEGPPPKREDGLGIKLASVPLRFLKCDAGPDERELNGFVDALRMRYPA
jgi:hypothetical protein